MPKGKSEELVEWYLRLNGYFIIPSFILHPLLPGQAQRTEIDLLGVRFPYQTEIVCDSDGKTLPMQNDVNLIDDDLVDCLIVSVKGPKAEASVNKSMKNPKNLKDIIKRFGCIRSEESIDEMVEELGRTKRSVRNNFQIRFLSVGGKRSIKSPTKQILLSEMVDFTLGRFQKYSRHKVDTEQWEGVGKQILANCHKSPQEIFEMILNESQGA